ncbi:MAG: hypothetical protein K5905_15040, partial [Roseibium sp.]|uniref:hypothetical protein n=1 Tax=Roseibium sp. TaxID=1936156 RepID=UPI0026024AE3
VTFPVPSPSESDIAALISLFFKLAPHGRSRGCANTSSEVLFRNANVLLHLYISISRYSRLDRPRKLDNPDRQGFSNSF